MTLYSIYSVWYVSSLRIKYDEVIMTQNKVNRDLNSGDNEYIALYCKEHEVNALTDDEFAVLQEKLKCTKSLPSTGNIDFDRFESGRMVTELGDDELGMYRRIVAASPIHFNCLYEYSKVFSFCASLGIKNIYDIGCGQQLQGLIMMYAPEMTSTGIDPYIFHDGITDFEADPGTINDRLAEFQGGSYSKDRIFYIQKGYPCELEIEQNNIAVMLYMGMDIEKNPKQMKRLTEALSGDFERIFKNLQQTRLDVELVKRTPAKEIVHGNVEVEKNVFADNLLMWKRAMPEFTFFTLGSGFVFATKNERDIKKLHANYNVSKKNEITAGLMDRAFYVNMMK